MSETRSGAERANQTLSSREERRRHQLPGAPREQRTIAISLAAP
jgi:hypothetical protein